MLEEKKTQSNRRVDKRQRVWTNGKEYGTKTKVPRVKTQRWNLETVFWLMYYLSGLFYGPFYVVYFIPVGQFKVEEQFVYVNKFIPGL